MSRGPWYLESEGRVHPLVGSELKLGRSRTCQIVLGDPAVSRLHALLVEAGEGWALRDLGSANGTFVNGERLSIQRPLAEGDRLVLGESELWLRRGDLAASGEAELPRALEAGDDPGPTRDIDSLPIVPPPLLNPTPRS